MSIIDIFTFKKEGKKIFSKENFIEILKLAREKIVEQAKENIPGIEKKIIVDEIVIAKITAWKNTCKNKMVAWVLDRIIEVIPSVTQLVYDFLKEKVESL